MERGPQEPERSSASERNAPSPERSSASERNALSPERDALLLELARLHGTPLWVLDLDLVRARLARLAALVPRVRYAQKANGLGALLAALREAGASVDAVSAGELVRATRAGFAPREVLFTADLLERDALALLAEQPFAVSVGTRAMLAELAALPAHAPPRETWLRVNPGFGHGHDAQVATGGRASKHGIWHAELEDCCAEARALGIELTGLHLHLGSGMEPAELARVQQAARALLPRMPASVRTLSLGGGLPIPYRPEERELELEALAAGARATRAALEARLGRALELELEPGRWLVGPAGVLLAEVRATKRVDELDFALCDAGFQTLARPALYGAYHAIRLLGREGGELAPRVVGGPLCESGDLLTRTRDGRPEPRLLPELRRGDLLAIEDVGAYGASMSSGYNARPLAAEVVLERGGARLARRRQTLAELCARDEPAPGAQA